jgi:hypothetical protein
VSEYLDLASKNQPKAIKWRPQRKRSVKAALSNPEKGSKPFVQSFPRRKLSQQISSTVATDTFTPFKPAPGDKSGKKRRI